MSPQQLSIGPTDGETSTFQSKTEPPDGHHSFEDFFMNKALEFDKTNIDPDSILATRGMPHIEKVQEVIKVWQTDFLADIKNLLVIHGKKMDMHGNA